MFLWLQSESLMAANIPHICVIFKERSEWCVFIYLFFTCYPFVCVKAQYVKFSGCNICAFACPASVWLPRFFVSLMTNVQKQLVLENM